MAGLSTNAPWLRSHRRLAVAHTVLSTVRLLPLAPSKVVDWVLWEFQSLLEIIDAGRADVEKSFRDCLARGWMIRNGQQLWDEIERFLNRTGGGQIMNPYDNLGDIICLTLKGARINKAIRDRLAGHPVDSTHMTFESLSPGIDLPGVRTTRFGIAANDEEAFYRRLFRELDRRQRVARRLRQSIPIFCIEEVSIKVVPLWRCNWWDIPHAGVVDVAIVSWLAPPDSSPRPPRSLR